MAKNSTRSYSKYRTAILEKNVIVLERQTFYIYSSLTKTQ